jgi:hypothetical protein
VRRAALAALAVIITSVMYLPVAESTVSESQFVAGRFGACTAFPADSLPSGVPQFRKASIDFRISK